MRSFISLPVPVRRGLVFAALGALFASACGEGPQSQNPSGTGSGGGAGAGGASASSSSSGSGGGAGAGGASASSSSSGSGGGCADACAVGAVLCQGNAVATCETLASGCTGWGTPVACPIDEVCSGGQCAKTCTNPCTVGATQCSGDGVQTCATMPNGCADWGSAVPCGAAETCSGGQCVATCTDQCTLGTTQCSGNGVQTCATMPNGCADWGSAVPCGAAMTCLGGQCASAGSTLAAGFAWTCALVNGIGLKCWGKNIDGELGLGDTNDRGDEPNEMGNNLPAVNLGMGKIALAIEAGAQFACAQLEGGGVKCWGANQHGQLGLGDLNSRGDGPNEMGDDLPAVNLGTGKTAVAISLGYDDACALLEGGSVKCWGNNATGGLGLGDMDDRGDGPNEMGDALPAVSLGAGKTAVAISAGAYHVCALLEGGSVKCWGNNSTGALGLGDTNDRGDGPNEMGDALPSVDLGAGKIAVAISSGHDHTCALLEGGSVKCWGSSTYGQLGQGDTNKRGDGPNEMGDNLPAVDLGAGKTAVAISAGAFHTCALLDDGSVKCWGNNGWGNLGVGDTNTRGDGPNEMGDNLPAVSLGTGKTAAAILAGVFHTCALLEGGGIKCWGDNVNGALGLGDTNRRGDAPNEMGDNLPPISL